MVDVGRSGEGERVRGCHFGSLRAAILGQGTRTRKRRLEATGTSKGFSAPYRVHVQYAFRQEMGEGAAPKRFWFCSCCTVFKFYDSLAHCGCHCITSHRVSVLLIQEFWLVSGN